MHLLLRIFHGGGQLNYLCSCSVTTLISYLPTYWWLFLVAATAAMVAIKTNTLSTLTTKRVAYYRLSVWRHW